MSSVVLQGASAAISATSAISPVQGDLKGRKVTHWSYWIFVVGSVVGAIAALAGFILSNMVIGIAGFILGLTNILAAVYIKKFSVLKHLDEYNRELSQKVHVMGQRISELQKVNQDLEKINQGIKKIPKDFRKEILRGKKELEKKTKQIEEVTAKLESAEQKLEKFAQLVLEIKKHTGELSETTLAFSKNNGFFNDNVTRLETEVGELNQHNEDLVKNLLELDAQTDEFEDLSKMFSSQIDMLDDMFAVMKGMIESVYERMSGLENEIDELSEVVPQAVESALLIEELVERYERAIENLGKKINKIS